jgi:hypothetical protein
VPISAILPFAFEVASTANKRCTSGIDDPPAVTQAAYVTWIGREGDAIALLRVGGPRSAADGEAEQEGCAADDDAGESHLEAG